MSNLTIALAAAGFETRVFCYGGGRCDVGEGSQVQYMYSKAPSMFLERLPKIGNLLRQLTQIAVIKKHGAMYDLIVPLGGPYKPSGEKKRVETVHSVGAEYLHPILEHPMVRTGISGIRELDNYVKDIANIYDYIMPITTYLSSMYRRNGRRKPIFLNPIIVNTAEFSFVKNAKFQSVRNLLYCGNLDHAREMELLVKSFSLVVKHKSDLKLRIVGGYSSIRKAHQKHSKLKSLCSKLGINDSVIFTGNISHSSVLKHYAGSDMFLLPRPYEAYSLAGFPSKLGEYLASGKPVVTTGTGDIPMYLEDGHTAYIVDMDNESAFSEKIATAIEDDRSNEIGAAGAEAAEKYFSIQATTRRISNFFVNTLCM